MGQFPCQSCTLQHSSEQKTAKVVAPHPLHSDHEFADDQKDAKGKTDQNEADREVDVQAAAARTPDPPKIAGGDAASPSSSEKARSDPPAKMKPRPRPPALDRVPG
mmetsp:Transcript_70039/g.216588  ORF Transcript_70039/g.216588 Transcript_70039/m.216588 type:complete len:106 (+) Transcript_70039:188-505(+)